jgi:hypothetical protein
MLTMSEDELEEDIRRTFRADITRDLLCLVFDVAATMVKTAIAYIVLRYVLDLDYQQALEVAVLLGCADFFAKPRRFTVSRDVRERLTVTRVGRIVEVLDEREQEDRIHR